jgi:hypothetical protein
MFRNGARHVPICDRSSGQGGTLEALTSLNGLHRPRFARRYHGRMQTTALVIVVVALVSLPSVSAAQSTAGSQPDVVAELRALRAELTETRNELQKLRADFDRLKAAAPQAEPAVPLATAVEILQSQVAEHAQTKVESASRMPLKILGTIHSTVASNTGEANWLDNPNLVAAEPARTGSFTASMRQTRLGIRAEGLALGSWHGSGAVVFDFFGGIPAFQTGQVMGLPRLVYAFARFERGGTALQVGQDEMMLAPRNPTSVAALSFPLLFRSGNLYLRTPQARFERRLAASDRGEVRAAVGIVAPVGGDDRTAAFTFVPLALAGERSRLPGVQGRVAWQRGDNERGASLGLSGHYSRERPLDVLLTSHAVAVDFHVQGERAGVAGEAFFGDNLDAFGGALSQVSESAGGFLEARLRPVPRWEVVFGGGTDRPGDPVLLTRNNSAYSSLTFRPTPEVATSFEYRWLETTAGVQKRRNHHFNWALAYSF